MSSKAQYDLPKGDLGLKGPVARPKPGTLPLRGDLAHIALADRYLVPHYVVPQIGKIASSGADLKLAADDASDTLMRLEAGSYFEILDFAGNWCWGCVSADGPSGYIQKSALETAAA
ncbi:hypothetical protein GRI43_07440 [Altererythrobacter luteolus]|uniref:Bacterial dipeptidyl-peptidase SH3 domain-containing protein n=1 Tax=Pontixanthobacter luteolus TaxID=295089 RepID=A0A6I4V5L4_9SPHN|nr:hypothetical protein [Pontixanthobacter luteolus]